MRKRSLVLLAHGSRNPQWRKPFDDLLVALRRRAGDASVCLALLQMGEPSLSSVVEGLVSEGAERIRILPMLMGGGNHIAEQVPAEVAVLRARHPGVEIEVLPPIGSHTRFKEMLCELVVELL